MSDVRREAPPLVELSLENVTYAPRITRASAAASASASATGMGSDTATSRRAVLTDASTTISPYCLSAWMGPSGSGKTSLLSVAAGLISDPKNDLIGHTRILVNGEEGALPKRLVGVVWQEDLLLSNLTVRETIRFAARLKNPAALSDEEVDQIVDDAIVGLGLSAVRDSLIGEAGGVASGSKTILGGSVSRGVSGGERKRVAVAVELVARPSVLLLDEPTSGLDATTAFRLMVTLKELATRGHAIAVVVHQPRTAIFDLFDELLLLSGGRVVYGGPPAGARPFLESCPGVGALPPQTGIADWIMDVIVDDESAAKGGTLPSLWAERRKRRELTQNQIEMGLYAGGEGKSDDGDASDRRLKTLSELASEPKYQTSVWTQLKLLTQRAFQQQRGDRITRTAVLMTGCWILVTSLAWGRIPDTTSYVHNRASLLFFFIIAQANALVVSSMTLFAGERALLSRERAKKMYGVFPYFIAKTLSDMVNSVALPLVYGATVYWIVNLRPEAGAYATFCLIYYLTISAAHSMGLFLSIAIPNMAVALMLAPLITLILMILGGFYIPLDSIHPTVRWASWMSMATYGFSALLVNEFDGRDVACDPDGYGYGGGVQITSGECPLPGEDVLASYGIRGILANVWGCVGILLGMQVLIRGATYVLLRRAV